MKSKMMNRIMCASRVGPGAASSRAVTFAGVARCAILLSSIASANNIHVVWRESPIGSDPGFTDVAVSAVNQYSSGFGLSGHYPFAVPGTYRLYDSSTVTVYSTDKVDEWFYVYSYTDPWFYMLAEGTLDLYVGTQISQSKGLINAVTVEFICQNEAFSAANSVAVIDCPEGGFPLYAEAWYEHGLKKR